ncbi:MAG: hydrogenase maturation protease [Caldisericia bacterium]|nr:hydrogenase maturation protease [Caldisericia bacterium]
MKKVIIGLGNPILSDDRVGLLIIDELEKRNTNPDISFVRLSSGGMTIVDASDGYDEAVLVDTIYSGQFPVGSLAILTPENFSETLHISNVHDINFATALKMGEEMGVRIPKKFTIYAIEVKEVLTFGIEMTKEVAENLPSIIEEIAGRELV